MLFQDGGRAAKKAVIYQFFPPVTGSDIFAQKFGRLTGIQNFNA